MAEIKEEEVLNSEKMFSFEQFHTVLEYAIELTGDEFYGLKMGLEPHIAGTVGMLAASCKNLKEAFIQGCKFFEVQGNFADISFIDDSNFPKIRYTITNVWQFKYPETARHEVDAMFSFLTTIIKVNSNNVLKPYKINFVALAPDSTDEYENVFGSMPNFNCEANEMFFKGK